MRFVTGDMVVDIGWELAAEREKQGLKLKAVDRLLPKSLFAWSKTFFDKSRTRSRRCQNSPLGLKQLTSLIFRFAKISLQKKF